MGPHRVRDRVAPDTTTGEFVDRRLRDTKNPHPVSCGASNRNVRTAIVRCQRSVLPAVDLCPRRISADGFRTGRESVRDSRNPGSVTARDASECTPVPETVIRSRNVRGVRIVSPSRWSGGSTGDGRMLYSVATFGRCHGIWTGVIRRRVIQQSRLEYSNAVGGSAELALGKRGLDPRICRHVIRGRGDSPDEVWRGRRSRATGGCTFARASIRTSSVEGETRVPTAMARPRLGRTGLILSASLAVLWSSGLTGPPPVWKQLSLDRMVITRRDSIGHGITDEFARIASKPNESDFEVPEQRSCVASGHQKRKRENDDSRR